MATAPSRPRNAKQTINHFLRQSAKRISSGVSPAAWSAAAGAGSSSSGKTGSPAFHSDFGINCSIEVLCSYSDYASLDEDAEDASGQQPDCILLNWRMPTAGSRPPP